MKFDDPEVQIARKLDRVVGTRFDEDASDPARGRRKSVVKWIVAAACAVGMAGLIVYGIESHRLPTPAQMQTQVPPPKPVIVEILPAKQP